MIEQCHISSRFLPFRRIFGSSYVFSVDDKGQDSGGLVTRVFLVAMQSLVFLLQRPQDLEHTSGCQR